MPQTNPIDNGIHTEIQVVVNEDEIALLPIASSKPDTPKQAIVFDRTTQIMRLERTYIDRVDIKTKFHLKT